MVAHVRALTSSPFSDTNQKPYEVALDEGHSAVMRVEHEATNEIRELLAPEGGYILLLVRLPYGHEIELTYNGKP
jgi:hypothetical protein